MLLITFSFPCDDAVYTYSLFSTGARRNLVYTVQLSTSPFNLISNSIGNLVPDSESAKPMSGLTPPQPPEPSVESVNLDVL
jgi:hypothetical protein